MCTAGKLREMIIGFFFSFWKSYVRATLREPLYPSKFIRTEILVKKKLQQTL